MRFVSVRSWVRSPLGASCRHLQKLSFLMCLHRSRLKVQCILILSIPSMSCGVPWLVGSHGPMACGVPWLVGSHGPMACGAPWLVRSHGLWGPMACGVPWSHGLWGPMACGVPWLAGSHGLWGPMVPWLIHVLLHVWQPTDPVWQFTKVEWLPTWSFLTNLVM
jgi:hypothetical protein